MLARDNKLDEDTHLMEDEKRFFKQVRELANNPPGYWAKEVFVETTNATVPHAGENSGENGGRFDEGDRSVQRRWNRWREQPSNPRSRSPWGSPPSSGPRRRGRHH